MFSHNKLSVYNVGDSSSLNLTLSASTTLKQGIRYRDAVQFVIPSGEYWLFDYGIIVFWGVDETERQALLNSVLNSEFKADSQLQAQTLEHFRFIFSDQTKVSQDTLYLSSKHALERLAISHALAQSAKLSEYEFKAQNTILQYSHLPEDLAQSGKIPLNRNKIAKIRGRLFSTKSDIILHYGLLDTPEFFWEYPEYEATYNLVAGYLDVRPRVELLSTKLATIHELFDMLADEQKHQHSSFLEWIIIFLIAIEIVIYFVEEIRKIN